MSRFLLPIILIIAAIGLFVVYTNPTYQGIQALTTEKAAYDNELGKLQQLRAVRDQLLAKRNTFSNEDVIKLQHVLPDNVDNIRLIIDINNIAARHNLSLGNVQIGEVSAKSTTAVGASGAPVGSVDVGFSIVGSYDTFLSFLQDLEHSLRIIDVQKITFTMGQGDSTNYDFSIRTYWLH